MKYLLDSNCFITPSRGLCPTDIAHSFWAKLKELAERGVIFTLNKVRDEIYVNDDDLSKWMKGNMPKSFFISFSGEEQVNRLQVIMNDVNNSTLYSNEAKHEFLRTDKADLFLTAYTSVAPSEWTVVSMEKSSPDKKTKIKLPDICKKYGVSCIQPNDMFRALKETF